MASDAVGSTLFPPYPAGKWRSDTAKKQPQRLAVILGSIEIKSEGWIFQITTQDCYRGIIQEAPQILSRPISQFPECGFR
jgi:hypothetical protein